MLTHEEAPESMPVPPGLEEENAHAKITIDGACHGFRRASRSLPSAARFSVSLTVADPADGERKFALAEGGTVNMPWPGKSTFWAGRSVQASTSSIPGWSTAQPKGCDLTASRVDRRERSWPDNNSAEPRRQSAVAADPAADRRRVGSASPPTPPARHTSGRAGRSSARRGSRAPRAASRRCGCSAPCSRPACRPTGTVRRSPRARPICARDRTPEERPDLTAGACENAHLGLHGRRRRQQCRRDQRSLDDRHRISGSLVFDNLN